MLGVLSVDEHITRRCVGTQNRRRCEGPDRDPDESWVVCYSRAAYVPT